MLGIVVSLWILGGTPGVLAVAAGPEALLQQTSTSPEGRRNPVAVFGGERPGDPRAALETDNEVQGALRGRSQKLPPLERVTVAYDRNGVVSASLPAFDSRFAGRIAALTQKNEFMFYTLDPELQDFTRRLVARTRAEHVAIVAMEPATGRVLAVAGRSRTISNIAFHAGFPAASLFKVVTAAAAIEKRAVAPESLIRFRGGNYTLGRENYIPNSRTDRREMTIGEAMGKSCNPVFGRIALQLLSPEVLRSYSRMFGFNRDLQCDVPVTPSMANIPEDEYEFSRTGAGFGAVTISPLHAATMMSGIANDGKLPRPTFVDKIIAPTGAVLFKSKPVYLQQIVSPHAARTLLDMMRYTTTVGTSRKEFMKRNQPVFPNLPVAAKTGTLTGTNPKGLNNWFIATAPLSRPQLAIAVVVVNPQDWRAKASHIGREVIGQFFEQ
jgi:cell division protein FtsI/penicillin-binding protein 2